MMIFMILNHKYFGFLQAYFRTQLFSTIYFYIKIFTPDIYGKKKKKKNRRPCHYVTLQEWVKYWQGTKKLDFSFLDEVNEDTYRV